MVEGFNWRSSVYIEVLRFSFFSLFNVTTVHSADGAAWYKQYAVDAVEKSPYMAPDGSIAYNESIVKKLPPTPHRKDKS